MENIASWPFERRLEESIRRALPRLGPEVQSQIHKILSPEALAIVATVLVAWVASHAIGVGEIIDIIIVVLGVFAIGLAVFEGLDHLYDFAATAYRAKSIQNLDQAADHFARLFPFWESRRFLLCCFGDHRRVIAVAPPELLDRARRVALHIVQSCNGANTFPAKET
jgi:hypothetical protein